MSTVSSIEGDRRKPKGSVLFTGPDGVGNYKVQVDADQYYVGHGTLSPEASSGTQYLYRGANGGPHPVRKTERVGEVGWGVPGNVDYSLLKSGHQIMLKEFRQAVEDRHTHLYQNPYYDPPQSKTDTLPATTDTVPLKLQNTTTLEGKTSSSNISQSTNSES